MSSSSRPQASKTSVDEEALAEYVYSKVIYQAGVDFESKPMVVVCACNLPNPSEFDYDKILARILLKLDLFVESDYTVVLFVGGAKHNPGWAWMFRAYKSLSRKYKKNLKSLYVVQPSSLIRFYFDFMNAIISPKFSKKVQYVHTLSELARYVPITRIDIPPAVYEYNLRYEDRITLPRSPDYGDDGPLMFGISIEELMGSEGEHGLPRVVKDCVTFIRSEGLDTEGVFRRSPSSILLRQAKEAYDRGNPVNLKDYGVHVAAVLLKMFFNDQPIAVFPTGTYDALKQIQHKSHPIGRLEFIRSNVFPLLSHATILLLRYVCGLLVDVSKRKSKNLMTPHNLAIMFAPNLVHSSNPLLDVSMCSLTLNDNVSGGGVGILMKLAIEHYDLMFEGYEELENRINDVIERRNVSMSSSITDSIETPETPSTTSSTPPKYPSIKRTRGLAALRASLSTSSDSLRVVGAGVKVSGVKVQGTVVNQLHIPYRDDPDSPNSMTSIEGLRRAIPWSS
ncbi:8158_t:CDS:2 [Acaulospora morrowiae]|uniref:8158_t:CDS:1 n=1 Tax=Acaulospora morrowiae TaxID=94023 RepID=A0A9N9FMQ4_9GLOM|nr:8158_t:CDS:2 [Acaulospora morrowiae]